MSSILLVVGPPRVGKSSLIDALTYGAFHREYYPQDVHFQVKLAKVAQHKVYEVQPIEWDGKPLGLVQFYASVADLIFIVVDVAGCCSQMQYVYELYSSLDDSKEIVLIANRNGKLRRNETLTTQLSLFGKVNQLKLYELDSRDLLSVQLEFHYITERHNLLDDLLQQNQNVVSQFLKCGIETLKKLQL